ncbi:8-oxo-dGDP phosphatase NUDT18-like isoform X1 [Babylonia areolata]|uniref:8-oxo-dGDP phosphatase NUDT18-like isoform X1 n=1 Tax=Babylonia areolata TaxID=304850 RepID=UPI003FD69B97
MSEGSVNNPVSEELASLIAGLAVPVHTIDFQRKDAMIFKPKTMCNVGYVVMVVIFNEHNQVLLIQESKPGSKGTWYLPGGLLCTKETLEEGAKREVLQGAGLNCDLTTLLSFHYHSPRWMRFTFLGTATGGKLKTLDEQDEYSMQAKFFDLTAFAVKEVNLRNEDIVSEISKAKAYADSVESTDMTLFLKPVTVPHSALLHRVVLVFNQESELMILAACAGGPPHIVTCNISPKDPTLLVTVNGLMRLAFTEMFCPRIHGVVGVEHDGRVEGRDGMCLTTLVSVSSDKHKGLPVLRNEHFMWAPVTDQASRSFLQRGMQGHLCRFIA